jgi:hypothetical protein
MTSHSKIALLNFMKVSHKLSLIPHHHRHLNPILTLDISSITTSSLTFTTPSTDNIYSITTSFANPRNFSLATRRLRGLFFAILKPKWFPFPNKLIYQPNLSLPFLSSSLVSSSPAPSIPIPLIFFHT